LAILATAGLLVTSWFYLSGTSSPVVPDKILKSRKTIVCACVRRLQTDTK